jgi:hypothetical protein
MGQSDGVAARAWIWHVGPYKGRGQPAEAYRIRIKIVRLAGVGH